MSSLWRGVGALRLQSGRQVLPPGGECHVDIGRGFSECACSSLTTPVNGKQIIFYSKWVAELPPALFFTFVVDNFQEAHFTINNIICECMYKNVCACTLLNTCTSVYVVFLVYILKCYSQHDGINMRLVQYNRSKSRTSCVLRMIVHILPVPCNFQHCHLLKLVQIYCSFQTISKLMHNNIDLIICQSVAYNENNNQSNVQIGIASDGHSSVYLVDSVTSAVKYNSCNIAAIPLKKKFLQIILRVFKIQFLPYTQRMHLHYKQQSIKDFCGRSGNLL